MRKLLVSLAIVTLLGLVGLRFAAPHAQEAETTVLGGLISRVLSTPSTRVTIGAVEGALSSDATIRDVAISDREGVWLRLDRARIVWSRLALLQRRLEIDRLEVGRLEILRRPLPSEVPVPGANEPVLPELPVKVVVTRFALDELALGAPILGTEARVTANGAASLGDPAEGLALTLDARRLDQAGTLAARLSLVPQTQALDLRLNLDEPAGGILARSANLPGLPPVTLDLNGTGTLDAFNSQLTFRAGDGIGAQGTTRLNRQGTARRLLLDLDARIEGLLPAVAAPVFAGVTQLDGDISFGDDGAVAITGLNVVSRTARLDVAGGLSVARDLDVTVSARAVPTDGARTVAGGAEIDRLVFDGTVQGPLTGPRIAATLDVANAGLPAGRVAAVNARFSATPNGLLSEPATRVALVAQARATGLALADPALARAIGDRVALDLRGASGTDGVVDIETLQLNGQALDLGFTGRAGSSVLDGRVTMRAPDLSRFGGVAGLNLRGRAEGTVDLSGVPAESRIEGRTNLTATNLATGIAPVDGALGGRLAIAGTVLTLPAGGYGFRDLRLTGQHASARLDGTATVREAGIDLTADLPDLRRLDARMTGRGTVTGRLSGTTERPDATARIEIADASALGRAIPRLSVSTNARDITRLLDARLDLDGTIAGKAAQGGLRLARRTEGGWSLSDVDLSVGSVSARGAVTLDAQSRADGQIAIVAGNLDDISPLVLTPLSGDLDARVTFTQPQGRQDVAIVARGNAMQAGGAVIRTLQADLRATNIYDRPVIDGTLSVEQAQIAGEAISSIRFAAVGTDSGSDLTLTADARGFALNAAGRLVPGDRIRLDLARLEARRGGRRIALAQPGSISYGNGTVEVDRIIVAVDAGRIELDGSVGTMVDLDVAVRALPLAAADIIQPGLGLTGTLDASAAIAGSRAAPTGDWRVQVAGLSAPQLRANGLPPVRMTANGKLAQGRSSVDAVLDIGRGGSVRARGLVPISAADALDLALTGRIDLGLLNALLAPAGRRAAGSANLDIAVSGTFAQPRADGSITLAGGSFNDAELGIALSGISGRINARGDNLTVESFSARTRNGGLLNLAGQVSLDAAAGFPGSLRLTGQRAELVSSSLAKAVANLALDISGPMAQRPTIRGRVDFASLDITVPDRLPTTLRPLENTRHINPPPQVRARLAQDARARARRGRTPAFDAVLDLVLSAPNRIFVRGRGIDAELGGDLRLTGTLQSPIPIGAFDLRRGRLQIGSQRLDFARGRLAFGGTLTPDLDFLAETRAADVTARIGVSGPANEPVFAFTSDPDLPADEVLSRILFAQASGGLNAGQALQLAQVAAQFSGGSGDDTFERLRRSLGVDSLDITLGASGSPAVGLSRAISDRVSVGVRAGATPEETGVSVDIDVTRRIRIQGDVTGNGSTGVGIGAEWEY